MADTAEEAAGEQRKAARLARGTAQRRRDQTLDEPSTTRAVRHVLVLLGRSVEQLGGAAGGLRRVWAGAMAEQGLSRRQIGERLGVTHQRVSALLAGQRQGDSSQDRR